MWPEWWIYENADWDLCQDIKKGLEMQGSSVNEIKAVSLSTLSTKPISTEWSRQQCDKSHPSRFWDKSVNYVSIQIFYDCLFDHKLFSGTCKGGFVAYRKATWEFTLCSRFFFFFFAQTVIFKLCLAAYVIKSSQLWCYNLMKGRFQCENHVRPFLQHCDVKLRHQQIERHKLMFLRSH